jgi:hypothetical protein
MNKETILKQLPSQVDIKNGICTALLSNELPNDWNIVIVGAAVEFYYDEGGSDIDADPNLNLTSNRSTTFRSKEPGKCVTKVHLVSKVQVPGENGIRIVEAEQDAAAGECATSVEFTLAPKPSISRSKICSAGLFDRVQINAR